jgi:F0F1-type ATP synthase assembly protein I
VLPDSVDRKELARYLQIGQVGLEMVVPVGIGMALDSHLGWSPWGLFGGVVLGLALGLTHLFWLANREPPPDRPKPPPAQEPPPS